MGRQFPGKGRGYSDLFLLPLPADRATSLPPCCDLGWLPLNANVHQSSPGEEGSGQWGVENNNSNKYGTSLISMRSTQREH